MRYFTVHYREEVSDSLTGLAEDTILVREGFNWWAFLIAPLWFVAKGMWLVLAFYIAIQIIIASIAALNLFPPQVFSVIGFGLNLLIGFEANNLYRWTLQRRRYRERGVIAGNTQEEAERNFFLSLDRA